MPLKKGSSDATVSANIKEMMHDVKHGDGKIGNRPPTIKKAQKVAVAVAMKKAGRSRNKKT